MSKDSVKTKQNRLQSIFSKLSPFDISEFLRSYLFRENKEDDISDSTLREIVESTKDESKVWTKELIEGAMDIFYKYPSLQSLSGSKLELLSPKGEFAKYIVSKLDSDPLSFKSAIFDIFTLLSMATTLNSKEQEVFFDSYPPRGEDLQCVGGTGSRTSDIMTATNSDRYGRYFVDSYRVSSSKIIEVIRKISHPGNAIHIPRYLEYILSLVSQDELDRIDDNTFSPSALVPTSYLARSLDDFTRLYKQSLIDSVSDERLEEESRIEIIEAIKIAIDKANKKTDDVDARGNILVEYSKYGEVSADLFDGIIAENDFDNYDNDNGEGPPNPRISLAIKYLLEELEVKAMDTGFYFNMDNAGQLEDGKERRLNVDRLIEELRQDKLNKIEKRFGELFFDAKEVIHRSELSSLGAKSRKRALPELPLSIRICSENIVEEITRKLKSANVQDVSSAIEILYLLSVKTSCNPALHFVEVMNNGNIKENLESIVRDNKFRVPQNYIEKITNKGDDSKRTGILDRYEEYLSEYKAYRELLASNDVSPRDRFAQMLTGSTQEALRTIGRLRANGELSEALSPSDDPDYRYHGVGNVEDVNDIVNRGDRYEIMKELVKDCDLSQDFLVELVHSLIATFFKHDSVINDLIDKITDINKATSLGYNVLNTAIILDQNNVAKKILSRQDVDVNLGPDSQGGSPLRSAIVMGNVEIFDLLIAKGADICEKDNKNITLLSVAVLFDQLEILKKLLSQNKININEVDSDSYTALHYAVEKSDPAIAIELLSIEGVDVDIVDGLGMTPFHRAICFGNQGAFRQLLDSGAYTNQPDGKGRSLLHLSISGRNFEIFQEIFSRNDICASRADNEGFTPLFRATIAGDARFVKELLLRKEVGIDRFDNNNFSNPLLWSSIQGHLEIVTELLSRGADINAKNKMDQTALHFAAQYGHLAVMKELISKGAKINERDTLGRTPLFKAVKSGHFNAVEELLSQDEIEISNVDSNGGNLLHVAAGIGHLEIFRKLLSTGMDIYQKNNVGQVPLHVASIIGGIGIIRCLLSIPGLDMEQYINQVNGRGETPLMLAATYDHLDVVKELIARGADVNQQGNNGSCALYLASMDGFLDVVKELLGNGAEVNKPIKEEDGKLYPLEMAIYNGHMNVAKALMAGGANVNLKNSVGRNVLHIAALSGRAEAVREILSTPGLNIGHYVNQGDNCGDTPLMAAAQHGHLDAAKELMANGANINLKNIYGQNAIHVASREGGVGIIREILSAPDGHIEQSINQIDGNHNTPLMVAVMQGHLDVVKELLLRGANINMCTKSDRSPLFLALMFRSIDIFDELLLNDRLNVNGRHSGNVLDRAVREDNVEVVRKLVNRGVRSRSFNLFQSTNIEMAKSILSSGVSIAQPSEYDHSGVSIAQPSEYDHYMSSAVEVFVTETVVNTKDKIKRVLEGLRPVRNFFDRSLRPTLDEFLGDLEDDKDAILNCQDEDRKNTLYFAVKAKPRWDMEKIVTLISHGANPNIKGYKDKTFAEYAFEKNKPEALKFLLTQSEAVTSEMIKRTIITKTTAGFSFFQDVLDKGSEEMIGIFIDADENHNGGRSLESIKDGVRVGIIQSQKIQAFIRERYPPVNSAQGPVAGALVLEDRELSLQVSV